MSDGQHAARLARLSGFYGIVGDEGPLPPVAWAKALWAGGACAVQLRFKRSTPREALALAREIRAALPEALLIVDDRPDLAVLAGADGVHVGETDLTPADARRVVGPALLVGATARNGGAAREALAAGADHLGVGPVFPSRTKALDVPALGLAGLSAVCRAVAPAPVVAISGIDEKNIAAVAGTGAACAAAIGAVGGSADPLDATRRLASAFTAGQLEAS
ncbi:MAG TPA: thiamine phosphate synthase [Myxococcales bacterium]|jgi:thiamine-phosphate pyrophosphorylase|nr:thiamine phosphate synthase [Myxococcales bacterium]